MLIDYFDLDAAVEWALYFQLPVETVPHQISSQLQSRQLYDSISFLSAFLCARDSVVLVVMYKTVS